MKALRFDVFGRRVLVTRVDQQWRAYYEGVEGKRRPAKDIVVPSSVSEAELREYLADLCHEWAAGPYQEVRQLR